MEHKVSFLKLTLLLTFLREREKKNKEKRRESVVKEGD